MGNEVIPSDFKRFVETFYAPVPRDESERIAMNFVDLVSLGSDRRQPLKVFFDQVMRFIFRQFGFSEIAIGLKDRNEEVWRYETAFGFTKEVEAKLFRTRYDRSDMYSQERFPNIKIGRVSELNVAEGLPEEETDKYDRPYRWHTKRQSPEEFLPGDFIDSWMLDEKKEIIGWIEVSGPKDRKQPPRSTVRWIELLACLSSEVVRCRRAEDDLVMRPRTPGPTTSPKA